MSEPGHFFSCDWGTSSFRLRLVEAPTGRILGELREDAGIKTIQMNLPDGLAAPARASVFADFLRIRLDTLAHRFSVDFHPFPTVVSGMASSSVGWHELPYATTPFPLDGSAAVVARIEAAEFKGGNPEVWLVSGVRTEADIMRGEECEVLGLAAAGAIADPGGPVVVLLPGTHAKHVWIQEGAISGFQTYMTGELADVLGRHSLLRASVRWPPDDPEPTDEERAAFQEGVRRAAEGGLSRHLFGVRARAVLQGIKGGVNGWYLGGLLIGDELRGLLEASSGVPILLAGSPRFSTSYELAFQALGAADRLRVLPPDLMEVATARAHAQLLGRIRATQGP